MFPCAEEGLRVEISEDNSTVLLSLDHDRAEMLARALAALPDHDGSDQDWVRLCHNAGEDTWLGLLLRLIVCGQNLRRRAPVP